MAEDTHWTILDPFFAAMIKAQNDFPFLWPSILMSLTYQTTVCNWLNKEWRDLSDLEATLLHKLPQYQLYYKDFSDLRNHRECKELQFGMFM